jgi:hypothetical protein
MMEVLCEIPRVFVLVDCDIDEVDYNLTQIELDHCADHNAGDRRACDLRCCSTYDEGLAKRAAESLALSH